MGRGRPPRAQGLEHAGGDPRPDPHRGRLGDPPRPARARLRGRHGLLGPGDQDDGRAARPLRWAAPAPPSWRPSGSPPSGRCSRPSTGSTASSGPDTPTSPSRSIRGGTSSRSARSGPPTRRSRSRSTRGGAYTEIGQLESLAGYDLSGIERPCDDLDLSAELQSRLTIPVVVEARVAGRARRGDRGAGRARAHAPPVAVRLARQGQDRSRPRPPGRLGHHLRRRPRHRPGPRRRPSPSRRSPAAPCPSDVTEPPRNAQIVDPPVGASREWSRSR